MKAHQGSLFRKWMVWAMAVGGPRVALGWKGASSLLCDKVGTQFEC